MSLQARFTPSHMTFERMAFDDSASEPTPRQSPAGLSSVDQQDNVSARSLPPIRAILLPQLNLGVSVDAQRRHLRSLRDDAPPECLRVPRPSRSDTSTIRFSARQASRKPSSADDVLHFTRRQVAQHDEQKREREERLSANNQGRAPSPSLPPMRCESSRIDDVGILPLTARQSAQCGGRKREREERSLERESSDPPSPSPLRGSHPHATASPEHPPLRFAVAQMAHSNAVYSHVVAPRPKDAPLRDQLGPLVLCSGQPEWSSSDLCPHRDIAQLLAARQVAQCVHRAEQQSERDLYHREIAHRTPPDDTSYFPPPTQSSFPTRDSSPPHANAPPEIPPLRLIFSPTTHGDADSSVGAPRINGTLFRYNVDPFVLSSLCPSQPECSPSDFQPHHGPTRPLSARQIAQRVRRRRELRKSDGGLYHRDIAPFSSGDAPCFHPLLQSCFPTKNASPPRECASSGIPPLHSITGTPTAHNVAARSHGGAPPRNAAARGDDDMNLFVLSSLCPSQPECLSGEFAATPPSARHIAQRTRRRRELQQRERGGLATLRRDKAASCVWRYTFFPPAASTP